MFLLPVHSVNELAPDVFELALERRGYPFLPGECAVLFDGGAESRPYSLASGPQEDVLRFLIRRLPGGAVSTWLTARRPGDGVRISTPFGRFRPAQEGAPGSPSVFVATGVGIAPFLSWARSELAGRAGGVTGRPICIYGVRQLREAVGIEVLRARTDLRLAVSREAAAGCHHGRVTGLAQALPLAAGAQYYLCGLDAMVDEVARGLAARGVAADAVHTEVFFNSPRPGR